MVSIYENIKSLITAGRIANAASVLGVKTEKVSKAVDILLPSLLALQLKAGDSAKLTEIASMAGKSKLANNLDMIFSGNGVIDGINFGGRWENYLLGVDASYFMTAVGLKANMKREDVDRLSNWVCGAIAAYFGKETVAGKKTMDKLYTILEQDKDALFRDIPDSVYNLLGLSSVFAINQSSQMTKAEEQQQAANNKKFSWIAWLIFIGILVVVILVWRACNE